MAAGNFPNCLKFTLHCEGGYCDNPRDPGGPTNLGVTIATYSHELGRAATIREMMALTIADVTPIYRKKYWNLIDGDTLPPGVDLLAFDIAVNSGVGRILPWLSQTRGLNATDRIAALDKLRRSFWQRLGTWSTFGEGWSARENACLVLAHAMNTEPRKVAA